MQLAAILLVLTALGGITMAAIRLKGSPRPPTWLAIVHGLAAVSGVVALVRVVTTQEVPQLAKIALGLFVAAAVGGSVLFFGFHRRGKELPIPFVLGHGALAATGVALLVMAAFS